MAEKHYKINEKTKTVTANITRITAEERDEIQTLVNFGYTFKADTVRRSAPRSKGKTENWFKENLTPERYKEFQATKAEIGGVAGFQKAFSKFVDEAEEAAKLKEEENEKAKKAKKARPKA